MGCPIWPPWLFSGALSGPSSPDTHFPAVWEGIRSSLWYSSPQGSSAPWCPKAGRTSTSHLTKPVSRSQPHILLLPPESPDENANRENAFFFSVPVKLPITSQNTGTPSDNFTYSDSLDLLGNESDIFIFSHRHRFFLRTTHRKGGPGDFLAQMPAVRAAGGGRGEAGCPHSVHSFAHPWLPSEHWRIPGSVLGPAGAELKQKNFCL